MIIKLIYVYQLHIYKFIKIYLINWDSFIYSLDPPLGLNMVLLKFHNLSKVKLLNSKII